MEALVLEARVCCAAALGLRISMFSLDCLVPFLSLFWILLPP
jgi:hypothetical protein